MLIILCALLLEARPLIEYYKLKKEEDSPFSIYSSDQISLCITGIGQIPMACAVGYMGKKHPKKSVWLNFGIAASLSDPLYSLVIPSSVSTSSSHKSIYPSYPFKPKLPLRSFQTFDIPQNQIKEGVIVDMESYSFFLMASRLTYLECVHSIKCISDQGVTSFKEIDQKKLEEAVKKELPALSHFVEELLSLHKTFFSYDEPSTSHLEEKWKLSVSEKFQALNLLKKCQALGIGFENIEEIIQSSSSLKSCLLGITDLAQTKEIDLS